MTPEEIDAEFEHTAPIGRALNAVAQAELAVAAVDEVPPAIAVRLNEILNELAADPDCRDDRR